MVEAPCDCSAVTLRKPAVIDLFAGAGGLSLGVVRAGFHLALAVELDKDAIATHEKNFPGFKHECLNVAEVDGARLMQCAGLEPGELDGLVGGPPCQGFSVMGTRTAGDPRNNLFVKFFELVAQCRPKFFVAENVPNIRSDEYSAIRERAFAHVSGDYTLLPPLVLKASDYGVPTIRERVFFIGYLPGAVRKMSHEDFAASKIAKPVFVGEALKGLCSEVSSTWLTEELSWRELESAEEPLPDSGYWRSITGETPEGVGNPEAIRRYAERRTVSGCFGTRHAPAVAARYGKLAPGQKDKISKAVRLKPDGFCPTLRAGTGSDRGRRQAVRPIHPILPRVITPREAARCQGFPDWFRFAPSKWQSFRQIGNSVCPPVAEAVFRVIRAKLIVSETANGESEA